MIESLRQRLKRHLRDKANRVIYFDYIHSSSDELEDLILYVFREHLMAVKKNSRFLDTDLQPGFEHKPNDPVRTFELSVDAIEYLVEKETYDG